MVICTAKAEKMREFVEAQKLNPETKSPAEVWIAWISAVSSSREGSEERRLKALGDNAVRWRHEPNVVIYEIPHATFKNKSRQNR